MFYVDQSTQKRYYVGTPFDYDGRQYTKAGATHANFIELGFEQVIVGQRPDSRFYIVSGPNAAGEYSSTPRDLAELKTNFCRDQLQTANSILSDSDFVFIRLAEESEGFVVPAALPTQRDEVRAVCRGNCALIEATASVEELEALIKAPAEVPEDPQAEERVTMENPDPHLTPYPTIDLDAVMTVDTL